MGVVELNIDEDNKEFIISGDIEKIIKNHRAKYFFLDFLKARFIENEKILIGYPENEREEWLKKIHDSLEKYGITQVDSLQIKEVLNYYYAEKENFKQFSLKAKKIWNNEVDANEFKNFKECLEREFPNRTLYDKQLL